MASPFDIDRGTGSLTDEAVVLRERIMLWFHNRGVELAGFPAAHQHPDFEDACAAALRGDEDAPQAAADDPEPAPADTGVSVIEDPKPLVDEQAQAERTA